MKISNCLTLSTSPSTQSTKKPCRTASLALRQRRLYGRARRYNTGKELDSETGLYYYGARYLDPRVSRWLSGDPAMGEYVPSAPVNDEARKRNGNLPGMGGVFNCVNLHAYHYAGNNPVRYTDPDGEEPTGWISSWMAEPDSQGGKSINVDAPQRAGRFSIFYELFTRNDQVCNVDSILFSFRNTEGSNIQLWFWKGNYNLVDKETWDERMVMSFEWHIGGEIGTYNGIPEFAIAHDNAVLSMSYSLYNEGNNTPFLTRANNGAFWLNSFYPGQAGNTGNIVMKGSITFNNTADAISFMRSYNNRGGLYFPSNNNKPHFDAVRIGATVDFVFQ